MAPAVDQISSDAVSAFRPFDVIENIRIKDSEGKPPLLKPLVILDDAHTLDPTQFRLLARDLARREIGFARWIMMRLDALTPADALLEKGAGEGEGPELKTGRDYYEIALQKGIEREAQRKSFRKSQRIKSKTRKPRCRHPSRWKRSSPTRAITAIRR